MTRGTSVLRRLGLTIAYFLAVAYILSVLLPALYCFQHGCKGGGEGDAFMLAFFLTPVGGIAAAFSLYNAVQNTRKKQAWSWVFWPLAIVFAIVLLGVIAFIALLVYFVAFHRR
jgi:Ni/Fe-hydrogenase subunit HybB-like protein